jgi:hypothetical protein
LPDVGFAFTPGIGYLLRMDIVTRQLETFLRRKPTLGSAIYIARGAVVGAQSIVGAPLPG